MNREGLEVRHALDGIRRCYYVLFQQMDLESCALAVPEVCPACGGPFAAYSASRLPRLICEPCGLVLVNT